MNIERCPLCYVRTRYEAIELSLPKIGLERQFEQLARIPIELKPRSETGCELNHMWPTLFELEYLR
jgi:hypothetical protein